MAAKKKPATKPRSKAKTPTRRTAPRKPARVKKIARTVKRRAAEPVLRRLDVGAGATLEKGWDTLDISPVFAPTFQHDLTQFPWPIEDNTYDEIKCWHVLEHLERKFLIPVMNEMWRVLKTGGNASIEVPVFPFWPAIADPTHVSFFVPQTFDYFDETITRHEDHRLLYGIKGWTTIGRQKVGGGGEGYRVQMGKV